MPQMSPLQWNLLNLSSTLLIILLCVIMFFKFNFKNLNVSSMLTKDLNNKISWKW